MQKSEGKRLTLKMFFHSISQTEEIEIIVTYRQRTGRCAAFPLSRSLTDGEFVYILYMDRRLALIIIPLIYCFIPLPTTPLLHY